MGSYLKDLINREIWLGIPVTRMGAKLCVDPAMQSKERLGFSIITLAAR